MRPRFFDRSMPLGYMLNNSIFYDTFDGNMPLRDIFIHIFQKLQLFQL